MIKSIAHFIALEALSFFFAVMTYGFVATGVAGGIFAGFVCFMLASVTQGIAFVTLSEMRRRL